MEMFSQLTRLIAGNGLRYLLFAGLAYAIFYVWKKNKLLRFKIQQRFAQKKAIRTELKYSFFTVIIFSVIIAATFALSRSGYTRIYTSLDDRAWWYFPVSIVLAIVLHDTYFYWTHRLMHWKRIFPLVHRIHHLSHNPTPLAAYSFHPVEAVIEAGILPLIAFVIPIHPFAMLAFSFYMIIMNVMGHLGYELFPEKFAKSRWIKWHNSSTHHNMHHHYSKGNYGLYFNFWDRLMGTNHPNYEEEFLKVAKRAADQKPSLVENKQPFAENQQSTINEFV